MPLSKEQVVFLTRYSRRGAIMPLVVAFAIHLTAIPEAIAINLRDPDKALFDALKAYGDALESRQTWALSCQETENDLQGLCQEGEVDTANERYFGEEVLVSVATSPLSGLVAPDVIRRLSEISGFGPSDAEPDEREIVFQLNMPLLKKCASVGAGAASPSQPSRSGSGRGVN